MELARCQRYYEIGWLNIVGPTNGTSGKCKVRELYLKFTKRASATIATISATMDNGGSPVYSNQSDYGFSAYNTASGRYFEINWNASAEL